MTKGNFLQKRDRPNTGYNFIGIAYRMALGLGLHREPVRESTLDTLSTERRRVVWWIVYSFDSGFSLTTGRPLMSSDCFIETQLPRNIEDSVRNESNEYGREETFANLSPSGFRIRFHSPRPHRQTDHILCDHSTGPIITHWKHDIL